MKKTLIMVLAILALMSLGIGSFSCSGRTGPVTIGIMRGEPAAALIYVAKDLGFSARNGIDLNFKEYSSGTAAADGMLKGEADLAATSEYVFVGKAFSKEGIAAVSTIVKASFIYIIGRKDRGIRDIADLKGKRIGVSRGTIPEFYLGRFLHLHGINMQDVTVVNVEQAKLADAITKGEVDAVVGNVSVMNQIRLLGTEVVAWTAQENQPAFGVVSARTEWIDRHPEIVERFLRALNQAEGYMITHPAESKSVLQKQLNVDEAYVEAIWPNFDFSLSLDLSLIIAMNDEARWMIENGLTREKTVPDFYDYVYIDGLKAVRPGVVSIVR